MCCTSPTRWRRPCPRWSTTWTQVAGRNDDQASKVLGFALSMCWTMCVCFRCFTTTSTLTWLWDILLSFSLTGRFYSVCVCLYLTLYLFLSVSGIHHELWMISNPFCKNLPIAHSQETKYQILDVCALCVFVLVIHFVNDIFHKHIKRHASTLRMLYTNNIQLGNAKPGLTKNR